MMVGLGGPAAASAAAVVLLLVLALGELTAVAGGGVGVVVPNHLSP